MNLNISAFSTEIERVFKSLIKSGRPDITDENNKNLVPKLYVDLFENNYVLNQVLDDNHILLKGRRGTGKSTVFLRAEDEIQKDKSKFAIYINLQTCYEEVRTANSDAENNAMTKYLTYKNFLTEILRHIQKRCDSYFSKNNDFVELFRDIETGKYIDSDFQRSIEMSTSSNRETKAVISSAFSIKDASLKADLSDSNVTGQTASTKLNELRIFSIHEVLKRILDILNKYGIKTVYLFLDDFSELNKESQKVVIDSLIAPIISSYNDKFKVKLAGYPGRVYTGNIDKTKLPTFSLDFYDAFELTSSNYNDVEDLSIQYIERTLTQRLAVYTDNQITLSEIFDVSQSVTLRDYLTRLFNCTSGIPRALGFILTYCYLSSINSGKPITLDNIDSASIKYYEENILSDFINDARFKQSFYDDKELLDQLSQKNLMDKISEKLFNIKREIIESYQKSNLKKVIYTDTIEQYRKGTIYWLPTSHFYVNKETEDILNTLELYFIVSKFHEGSSREPGKKISHYGLNYGLCLTKKIDYGRPAFRRTYDYWRQEEFNFNNFITSILSSIEVISCQNCNKEYTDLEYSIYVNHKKCFKCGQDDTVLKINKFYSKLKDKLEEWNEKKLPNSHVDILRTLYNNRENAMSAFEIGNQIDRHHLSITHATRSLSEQKLVTYEERDKRYYKVSDLAISRFFSDTVNIPKEIE
ncbi:hypothetical protein [uncultured Brevibacillus sp.]|uniref:hypothetical protein n=1 Tax=uncultured Brevibacillus sp. TaxID=169970 RepID=UPI00259821AC|nr:hypothetical protein [uncultured Brevibacillus sp.]